MSKFEQLGLSPKLLKRLDHSGFSTPTPIQAQAIPLALEGHDIMGLAQTGTGKTLAFGLPMIDALLAKTGKPAPKTVKALILAPTRELVNQISDNLRAFTQPTPLTLVTVVGGTSMNQQIKLLDRGVDILVATPGRLIDHMNRGTVNLSTVRHLVLDEADQMLDMGFIHDLRKIAPKLGTPRQTMLFSATMAKQMEELSRSYLTNPRKVQVATPGKTANKIDQTVLFMEKVEKPGKLREVLSADPDALSLVFARTKHGAERLKKKLVADGYLAASIHGDKSQGQRDKAIKAFRDGKAKILVATDVAARGIDIPGVGYVINYDLPNAAESYVHRIGRTARAGLDGTAISFCSPEERGQLRDIEKLIGLKFGDDSDDDTGAAPKSAPSKGKDRPARPPRRRNRRRRNGRNASKPKGSNPSPKGGFKEAG
ncbi:MAG: DEAD/DEAH box helicase [Pseudomonadota bacterium]